MLIFAIIVILAMVFLVYASCRISVGFYLKSLCQMPTSERVVALTFDDGPHAVQTPKVLDLLQKNNVKAAFFCIAENMRENEQLVRRIACEGHLLANHTQYHRWYFPFLSAKKMERELGVCQAELQRIAGCETRWFRPPFGVTNPNVARTVRRLSLVSVGWSIRSFDTRGESDEHVLARIRRKLRPGAILLLHDRLPNSDVLLQKIIDLIREENYTIVRFDFYKK